MTQSAYQQTTTSPAQLRSAAGKILVAVSERFIVTCDNPRVEIVALGGQRNLRRSLHGYATIFIVKIDFDGRRKLELINNAPRHMSIIVAYNDDQLSQISRQLFGGGLIFALREPEPFLAGDNTRLFEKVATNGGAPATSSSGKVSTNGNGKVRSSDYGLYRNRETTLESFVEPLVRADDATNGGRPEIKIATEIVDQVKETFPRTNATQIARAIRLVRNTCVPIRTDRPSLYGLVCYELTQRRGVGTEFDEAVLSIIPEASQLFTGQELERFVWRVADHWKKTHKWS